MADVEEFVKSHTPEEVYTFLDNATIEELKQFINTHTSGVLKLIFTARVGQRLAARLDADEYLDYMFAKNIKIYGGIDIYINDFFSQGSIQKINTMQAGPTKDASIFGAIMTLRKMKEYDITPENRERIQNGLRILNGLPAPAAGGKRKSKKTRSKTKSKSKSKRRQGH